MLRAINLWFALLGLQTSRLRSALTTMGIIIGVGAVIIIVSLGNGLRRSTEQQLEEYSAGTIEIRPQMFFGGPMMAAPMREGGVMVESNVMQPVQQTPQLYWQDVEALRRLARSVQGLAPQFETYGQVVYRGRRADVGQIVGVTPEYLQVYKRELAYGRFITEEDSQKVAPVVVVDESVAERIFGKGVDPLGKILHISLQNLPQNYMVVGVLKQQAQFGRTSYALLVPLRTAQLRLNPTPSQRDIINLIAARSDSRDSAERKYAVAELNTILRARHKLPTGAPEDFGVYDTLEFSDEITQITRTITLVLSLIAGISLIVGSIGLMNIMLVTVSERTWEIGLRRAVGARRVDVLSQFLAEAILLSLLGGFIGFVLGVAGSYGISRLVEQLKGQVSVTPDIVLIAVGVSVLVGTLSGLYPAWHAARLQPTQALRYT